MNIPLDDVSKDKNFINAIKYTVRLFTSTFHVPWRTSKKIDHPRQSGTKGMADKIILNGPVTSSLRLCDWPLGKLFKIDLVTLNVKLVIDLVTEKSTLVIEVSCQTD